MWWILLLVVVIVGAVWGYDRLIEGVEEVTIGSEANPLLVISNEGILAIVVVLLIAVAVGMVLAYLFGRPGAIKRYLKRRGEVRGHEAQARGMLAVDVGDQQMAHRFANAAHKALPDDPLTSLLQVKAAQLGDDKRTARKLLETMTESPETELAGLHGLYLEAEGDGETEAARQFAERAMKANPRLGWGTDALFCIQCKTGDWRGAIDTLGVATKHKQIDRDLSRRRRAVLLTALAMQAERGEPAKALDLALEAHKLAPDLVPAAAMAGHLLAAKNSPRHAARVTTKTWRLNPHPDLAMAYAHIRPGDSPKDRLERVEKLAAMTPDSIEGPIAVANAAIDARDWETARKALTPYFEDRPPARICTAMARIEDGAGFTGRSREWLARALRAPRDPAWTADGVVSKRWLPISPVTGQLDAFQWKVPLQALDTAQAAVTFEMAQEPAGEGNGGPAAAERSDSGEPDILPPEKAIDLPDDQANAQTGLEAEEIPPEKAIDMDKLRGSTEREDAGAAGEATKDLDPLGGPPDRAA